MQKTRQAATKAAQAQRMREVNSLASRALAVLAARVAPTAAPLDEEVLALLETAAFEQDRSLRLAALDAIQARGVSDDSIVDLYIPSLARKLGEDWCDDRLSFAEVTIGVSRLQSMLHDIAVDWAEERPGAAEAPEVLIVVRDQEYHTLGALIAATQFRRHGAMTRVALGVTEDEILSEALYGKVELIAVSASPGEKLDFVARLVEKLRERGAMTVVAVGGSILESDLDVAAITGADIITHDPREALAFWERRKFKDGGTISGDGNPSCAANAP